MDAAEHAAAVSADAEIGDLFTSRAEAFDYLYSSRTDPAVLPRVPGDFIVYRFTGSHLESPVILTQRVVARKASTLVVDQVIDDGREPIHLRLRVRDISEGNNEIISVARVVEGVQLPFGTATYEALMDRVLPPIEGTEQLLGSARAEVDVNGHVIECEKTAYRVHVGGQPAYLTVMQNPSFVWGDVGGEIRDGHGKLLYRAEVILVSGSFPMPGDVQPVVARQEHDLYAEIDRQGEAGEAEADGRIDLTPRGLDSWVAAQEDLEAYDDWDELR
jgi:hypothetical protein